MIWIWFATNDFELICKKCNFTWKLYNKSLYIEISNQFISNKEFDCSVVENMRHVNSI